MGSSRVVRETEGPGMFMFRLRSVGSGRELAGLEVWNGDRQES